MKILAIETSCDETGVTFLDDSNGPLEVLSSKLFSQIDMHAKYGGVYPDIAKREHAKRIPLLLGEILEELHTPESKNNLDTKFYNDLKKKFYREEEMLEALALLASRFKPDIDVIFVTRGPGLAPALWVGVTAARILSYIWDIPVVGVNHMEGHLVSPFVDSTNKVDAGRMNTFNFPSLALLISGGHTEIIRIDGWGDYEKIGQTLDDALGEAFDKVARLLGLGYPGGREISKIASNAKGKHQVKFPRPMINSDDLNFSFSGLKTSVLYHVEKISEMTDDIKADIANEFEKATIDVLTKKVNSAIIKTDAKNLIVAGGVAANKKITEALHSVSSENKINLYIPKSDLTGDNSVMIGLAGYMKVLRDGIVNEVDILEANSSESL